MAEILTMDQDTLIKVTGYIPVRKPAGYLLFHREGENGTFCGLDPSAVAETSTLTEKQAMTRRWAACPRCFRHGMDETIADTIIDRMEDGFGRLLAGRSPYPDPDAVPATPGTPEPETGETVFLRSLLDQLDGFFGRDFTEASKFHAMRSIRHQIAERIEEQEGRGIDS